MQEKRYPQQQDENGEEKSWWLSTDGIVAILFISIIGFYLITEHTAHIFGILPFFIFLLCPLMHLFMHHGHGDHGDENHKM